MGDLEGIANEIRNALKVINDPTFADKGARSLQLVNELSTKPPQTIYQLSTILTQNRESDYVRHFGFQMIENMIWKRSNELQLEDIARLKKDMVSMLSDNALGNEPLFLLEKKCKLFGVLAARIWPDKWSDLFQALFKICMGPLGSGIRLETTIPVFKVLRNLYEYAYDDWRIIPGRARKMKDLLRKEEPKIMELLLRAMQKAHQNITSPVSGRTLDAALNLYALVAERASLNLIFKDDILLDISKLLDGDRYFEKALLCVEAALERKLPQTLTPTNKRQRDGQAPQPAQVNQEQYQKVLVGLLERILNLLGLIKPDDPLEEDKFIRLLAILHFLQNQPLFFYGKQYSSKPEIEQLRTKLFTLLSKGTESVDSTPVLTKLFEIWFWILPEAGALLPGTMDAATVLPGLFQVCLRRLRRQRFEDDDEKKEWAILKTAICRIIGWTAQNNPKLAFEIHKKHILPELKSRVTTAGNPDAQTIWDAAENMFGTTCSKTTAFQWEKPEIQGLAQSVLEELVQIQTSDPLIVRPLSFSLAHFIPCIPTPDPNGNLATSIAGVVAEFLLRHVKAFTFTGNEATNSNDVADYKAKKEAKRRALYTLVAMAKKSKCLVPLLKNLVTAIVELIQNDEEALTQSMLVLTLICVCNNLENQQERLSYMQQVLEEYIGFWTSVECKEMVTNPNALIELFTLDDSTKKVKSTSMALLQKFRVSVETLHSILENLIPAEEKNNEPANQNITKALYEKVAPNAFKAVKLYSHLFNPANRSELNVAGLEDYFDMVFEVHALTKARLKALKETQGKEGPPFAAEALKMASWLNHTYIPLVKILSLQPHFGAIPTDPSAYLVAFQEFPMEYQRLAWSKLADPLFTKANPPEACLPHFHTLLKHVVKKCNDAWGRLKSRSPNTTSNELEVEILEEKWLAGFSQDILTTVNKHLIPPSERGCVNVIHFAKTRRRKKKKKKPKVPKQPTNEIRKEDIFLRAVFSHGGLPETIFEVLLKVFDWPEPSTRVRGTDLLIRLVKTLGNYPQMRDPLQLFFKRVIQLLRGISESDQRDKADDASSSMALVAHICQHVKEDWPWKILQSELGFSATHELQQFRTLVKEGAGPRKVNAAAKSVCKMLLKQNTT